MTAAVMRSEIPTHWITADQQMAMEFQGMTVVRDHRAVSIRVMMMAAMRSETPTHRITADQQMAMELQGMTCVRNHRAVSIREMMAAAMPKERWMDQSVR